MKNILMTASAVALSAGGAVAGGVERSTQSVAILFEKGNYAELSFGFASPDVSGTFAAATSGDMADSYTTLSFGYKQALSDNLDVAIILDQPIGANVNYGSASATYPFRTATAKLTSTALTGLIRYKFASNISVYGGLRAETVKGVVAIPTFANYTLTTNNDLEFGYVVGAAWERPDIAARIALTYNSEITHSLESSENSIGGPVSSSFDTTVPQSLNLEFQTGIAADTLLFGSVRWVDWTSFIIAPPAWRGISGGTLVDYSDDSVTYTLGVGRKFSEQWSGAVTLGYEAASGSAVGNLGPTDGMRSISVGATYTMDNMKITGGVRYVDIGDAVTRSIGARFTDNSALAAGVKVGWTF